MVEDAICLIVFFVFGIIALLMNIVVPKSRTYFITHPNKFEIAPRLFDKWFILLPMDVYTIFYWFEIGKLTLYSIFHNFTSIKETYELHQRLKNGEEEEEDYI